MRNISAWRPVTARSLLALVLALCACAGTLSRAAAEVVSVPIRLHGVHIYVEITVNGKPGVFVLDTGASANVITPEAVTRFGLVPGSQKTPLTGAGARAGSVADVKISELGVGGYQTKDQVAYVISLPEQLPCDGLLGTPFLQKQIVTIDYERLRLILTPQGEFKPPDHTRAIGMHLYGNTPFIEAVADGHKGSFRIDTGAGNAVTLFDAFVTRNQMHGKYSPSLRLVTGRGVGGLLTGDLARLPDIAVGPFHFTQTITEFSRQKEGTFGDRVNSGNIGGEIWQRFTITFDYAGNKVYLAPNSNFGRPFAPPRSGLALDTDKGIHIVQAVTPNSPASDAGVAVGDRVTAVDGVPIAQIKPWVVTEKLRSEPGTTIRLHIQSKDGSERDVTLTLRDLL